VTEATFTFQKNCGRRSALVALPTDRDIARVPRAAVAVTSSEASLSSCERRLVEKTAGIGGHFRQQASGAC